MKYQSLCMACMFAALNSFAQQGTITCSNEKNSDNSVSIYADSHIYGEYTIKLTFAVLQGYTYSVSTSSAGGNQIALIKVMRGRREIMKLFPIKNVSSSYKFKYTYYPTIALRKWPDSNFVYLIPAKEGKEIRALRVNYIGATIGQKPQDPFSDVGFVYTNGDTICAARAGIIYDCSDEVKEGEKGMEIYKKQRNHIYIQHRDGTLAQYSILAPIQLLLTAGDEVIPGQPMAVFNKESEKHIVLFSVNYLDEKRVLTDNINTETQGIPSHFRNMPMVFCVDATGRPSALVVSHSYTTFHPKTIITQELSKKEKKKLGL